jgi:hypothetical protein
MSGQEENQGDEQANSRQGRARRNRPRTKSTSDVRGMFVDPSTPTTTAAQQMMCPRVSSSPGK